jgi:hypothetical protein
MLAAGCKRHSGVGSRKHYTSNSAYKVDFLEPLETKYLRFSDPHGSGGCGRRNRPLDVA